MKRVAQPELSAMEEPVLSHSATRGGNDCLGLRKEAAGDSPPAPVPVG